MMNDIKILSIVFLLLSTWLIPVVSANDIEAIHTNESIDAHPAYYNVTRYHFKGFFYEEETIRVSYEDAMRIKKEFEELDSLNICASEKNERKKSVLKQYDLLLEGHHDQLPPMRTTGKDIIRKNSMTDDTNNELLLLMTSVDGTIGPCFINLFSFIFGSLFFVSFAEGADLTLLPLISGEHHFQTDDWVQFFMVGFIGLILVIPFISPGGYMAGVAMFGFITY